MLHYLVLFDRDVFSGFDSLVVKQNIFIGGSHVLKWGRLLDKTRSLFIPSMSCSPIVDDTLRREFVRDGVCPRCGDTGVWKSMALVCEFHGRFIG
jgi:hypothetical protein